MGISDHKAIMDGTRFIVAGSFIDGNGGEARRHVFLAVKDGIITAIGPATDLPRANGAAIADFSRCTIVPPLVDGSVSLSRSPAVDRAVRLSFAKADPATKAALVARHIRYCHAHGVLGVAENDDISDLLKRLPGEMAPPEIIAIRTPGRLGRTGEDGATGHPTGGDFLRVVYSGDIEDEEPPSPRLAHEDLCRILREKGEKKAVVVANGRQQVQEALAAGCDAIEQGYGMGADNIREMAAREVLWIPGVLRAKNGLDGAASGGEVCCRFSQRYVAPGQAAPGVEAFWKKMLADQLRQLRLARQLGVTAAVGTGAGSAGILHGEAMVEEMKLFIKAGYSRTETIRCASVNNADFFGMANLGTLTVGRKATFLIARGGVEQLPRKLAYLEGIYVDGAPSPAYRKHPGGTGEVV